MGKKRNRKEYPVACCPVVVAWLLHSIFHVHIQDRKEDGKGGSKSRQQNFSKSPQLMSIPQHSVMQVPLTAKLFEETGVFYGNLVSTIV